MSDTKQINDGGPAFPSGLDFNDIKPSAGMTLRDYAIIHFMAALMQREDFNPELGKVVQEDTSFTPSFLAVEQADAMLAARKEKV